MLLMCVGAEVFKVVVTSRYTRYICGARYNPILVYIANQTTYLAPVTPLLKSTEPNKLCLS